MNNNSVKKLSISEEENEIPKKKVKESKVKESNRSTEEQDLSADSFRSDDEKSEILPTEDELTESFVSIKYENTEGYLIDQNGRIWNTLKECLVQPRINPINRYKEVYIRGETHFVHRLVAFTFLTYDKLVVNHINGDRLDNRLENLEWTSRRDNIKQSLTLPSHKKPLLQLDKDGKIIAEFPSAVEASETLKVSASAIRKAIGKKNSNGECKLSAGYAWRYALEEDQKVVIKQTVDLDRAQKLYNYDNYFLLETGQVYNKKSGKTLKPTGTPLYVTLSQNNKKKNWYLSVILRDHTEFCSFNNITNIVA